MSDPFKDLNKSFLNHHHRISVTTMKARKSTFIRLGNPRLQEPTQVLQGPSSGFPGDTQPRPPMNWPTNPPDPPDGPQPDVAQSPRDFYHKDWPDPPVPGPCSQEAQPPTFYEESSNDSPVRARTTSRDEEGDVNMERRTGSPDGRDVPLPLSPTPQRPNSPPQPILGKRGKRSDTDRASTPDHSPWKASTPSTQSPQKSRAWQGFASNVMKGYAEIHSSDDEGEDTRMSDIDPGDLSALVVPIKRGAKHPYRATTGSAGYDLYLPADITLRPHTITTVPLGLQIQLPQHYYLQLKGRSSLEKKGINLRGGVVDSDFRGDIAAILSNTTAEAISLSAGQKVCQGIILKYHETNFIAANKLQPTIRSIRVFGHSS
ncbi:MAG: hypothetical protein GY696_09035 [Gammaproteobacteria bacterium]|nr:hypothetical protein [Gammaproteobacteria bacterium]